MNLDGKVVLITGASSGIGWATAEALAGEGARLLITGRRAERLADLRGELHKQGAEVAVVTGDVTLEADCQSIVKAAVDAFGTVDVLVNNAGYGPPTPLLDVTVDLWETIINSCLKSVYLMTRAVLPMMLEKGGGTIVQISSIAGKNGYANHTTYCTAKWGMQGFTEALRDEFGDRGIRAHIINPGAVATPWWETTNDAQSPEVMERMIKAEEVAEAVRWALTQPERIQIDEIVVRPNRSPWE